MRAKPHQDLPVIPAELLVPLQQTGFFKRFKKVDLTAAAAIDAVLPASTDGDDLSTLGGKICAVYREYVGVPSRTSLTGHWMGGPVLFSAAWEHVPGWVLDVTIYEFHTKVDGPALRIRIKHEVLPPNPVGILELVDPGMHRDAH